MKRTVSLILSLLMLLALAACGNDAPADNQTPSEDESSFAAMVVDVQGTTVTVEPLEGTAERRSSDRITFSIAETDVSDLQYGDRVLITYSGGIMETYPAQIRATVVEKLVDTCDTESSDVDPDSLVYRKPVIYLYPEEETDVSVTLDLKGELTCTYPSYQDGWTVTAAPDGTLTDSKGQTYSYLYWEGTTDAAWDMDRGFCVKGEDTAAFLEESLAALGLTRREANEFIVYWLPLMQENPYNLITFQTDVYEETAPLTVTPTPDTVIRVFMVYVPCNEAVEIAPQTLSAPVREGFTVVEWGGAEGQ